MGVVVTMAHGAAACARERSGCSCLQTLVPWALSGRGQVHIGPLPTLPWLARMMRAVAE